MAGLAALAGLAKLGLDRSSVAGGGHLLQLVGLLHESHRELAHLVRLLEKLGLGGVSHIYFVIGGSLGLSDKVLKRADARLSFSKMTFPHQLMRVILLEQIYRSYRIMHHEPYHK